MGHGDGTIREIFDKRINKSRLEAKIFIDGKPKTARFECTKYGRKEANEWLRSIRRDKEDEIHPSNQTLGEAIGIYIKNNDAAEFERQNIKLNTLSRTFSTIKGLPKWLKDMPVSEAKKDEITKALSEMSKRMGKNGTDKALAFLNRFFKNEVDNGRLRSNPCSMIKRSKAKETKEIEIYSKEEIIQLIRGIHYIMNNGTYHSITHNYDLFFKLLLTTGMRIGELLALQWEQIDLTEGKEMIKVKYTLDSHWYKNAKQKGLLLNTPKTQSSNRNIPLLSPHVIRTLKKEKQKKGKHIFLFETKDGKAIDYHNFYKTWDNIGKEAARKCPHCHTIRPNDWICECGNHVTRRRRICQRCNRERPQEWICPTCGNTVREIHKKPHTTRHTFISFMIAKGYPIATISKIAGHSSPKVTLDVYTHATDNYIEELRSLVKNKK